MFISIFNITESPVYITDCYTSVQTCGRITIKRSVSEFSKMRSVHAKMKAREIAIGFKCSQDEEENLRKLSVW